MLDLQSVGTFLPLINPVADDFVQRILNVRDPQTGIVQSLHNEIAKWNLECKFGQWHNELVHTFSYVLYFPKYKLLKGFK